MKKTIIMEQCDNPSCGTEYRLDSKAQLVPGYHIPAGVLVDAHSVRFGPVFACSEDCIGPAIEHVATETYEKPKTRRAKKGD